MVFGRIEFGNGRPDICRGIDGKTGDKRGRIRSHSARNEIGNPAAKTKMISKCMGTESTERSGLR